LKLLKRGLERASRGKIVDIVSNPECDKEMRKSKEYKW